MAMKKPKNDPASKSDPKAAGNGSQRPKSGRAAGNGSQRPRK